MSVAVRRGAVKVRRREKARVEWDRREAVERRSRGDVSVDTVGPLVCAVRRCVPVRVSSSLCKTRRQ